MMYIRISIIFVIILLLPIVLSYVPLRAMRIYFIFWEEGFGFILDLLVFAAIPAFFYLKKAQKHRNMIRYVLGWTPLVLSSTFSSIGFQLFLISPLNVTNNQLSYIIIGGLISLMGNDRMRTIKTLVLMGCLMSLAGSLIHGGLVILGVLTITGSCLWMFGRHIYERSLRSLAL